MIAYKKTVGKERRTHGLSVRIGGLNNDRSEANVMRGNNKEMPKPY